MDRKSLLNKAKLLRQDAVHYYKASDIETAQDMEAEAERLERRAIGLYTLQTEAWAIAPWCGPPLYPLLLQDKNKAISCSTTIGYEPPVSCRAGGQYYYKGQSSGMWERYHLFEHAEYKQLYQVPPEDLKTLFDFEV